MRPVADLTAGRAGGRLHTVATERRSWPNPLGRAISLTGLAAAGGVVVLTAALALVGPEDGPRSLAFLPLAAVVPLVWLALRPTWSVTVGRRGVGLRRLGRQRFVPRESLRGVRRPAGPLSALWIETDARRVVVWPPPPGDLELAARIETLARETGRA